MSRSTAILWRSPFLWLRALARGSLRSFARAGNDEIHAHACCCKQRKLHIRYIKQMKKHNNEEKHGNSNGKMWRDVYGGSLNIKSSCKCCMWVHGVGFFFVCFYVFPINKNLSIDSKYWPPKAPILNCSRKGISLIVSRHASCNLLIIGIVDALYPNINYCVSLRVKI